MIRILLADDQDLIRRGLKALLRVETDLEVVGEAADGQAAIAQALNLQPDIVLMDIRMPVMDGVAATQALQQQCPQVKVLVLTTFDDDDYVTRALQNGAVGYLLKDTPPDDLVQAIHLACRGYSQLSPGIIRKMMQQALSPSPSPETPPGWDELTPRELEILTLIAQGANNREIATQLYIAEKTVKNHITNILGRLGVRDRTQAAILANRVLAR
ncbi:MAG: response regulator transcription factor [Spirulina sp. SIO3F2]|nr:response regulator transcription factor [Spirulina sp. SIO3F2]